MPTFSTSEVYKYIIVAILLSEISHVNKEQDNTSILEKTPFQRSVFRCENKGSKKIR